MKCCKNCGAFANHDTFFSCVFCGQKESIEPNEILRSDPDWDVFLDDREPTVEDLDQLYEDNHRNKTEL